MVSAAESPVHDNWKQAVIDATETDTVFLNSHTSPALRALRTETTNALEFATDTNAMGLMAGAMDRYFRGDLAAAIARSAQLAGRIAEVRPVAELIAASASGCPPCQADLAPAYPYI